MHDDPIPSRLRLSHTPLPAPDLSLALHAHDVVELGAWLLASRGASLLTITLCAAERDPAMPVMLWDGSLMAAPELSRSIAHPSFIFRALLKRMEEAATHLFLSLSPRWPGSTPPPGLGMVTDGRGLGFCPDDPCPLVPGWIARRVRDRIGLTCLLHFPPESPLATLARTFS